jgi:hypothetical protein
MKSENLGSIDWKDIWEVWRTDEEESWREHYQARGFESWDAWRRAYIQQVKPEGRSWELHKLEDYMESTPEMFVGPFRGWSVFYSDREHSRFKDIVTHPTFHRDQKDKKMREIEKNFPARTQIIGLKFGDKIMIGEGTHRCCAIALAAHEGRQINSRITLALTEYSEDERESFESLFNNIIKVPLAHKLNNPSV